MDHPLRHSAAPSRGRRQRAGKAGSPTSAWQTVVEAVALPVLALGGALLLFGVFVRFSGANPVDAWLLLFKGAFGDAFSWQSTLQRAAPLMLTALCVALPARAGLTDIGGGGGM